MICVIRIQQVHEYIHFFYCTIHEYIHLFLLYNNRLDSSTSLTEKNILPISRVFANKAEGRVPEESVNFELSDFYLVPGIEVNEFLGTQGDSVRNSWMKERLGLEKIDIHRAGDSVKSEEKSVMLSLLRIWRVLML